MGKESFFSCDGPSASVPPRAPSRVHWIVQGEAAITDATSGTPIIGSVGATSCVIISAYNRSNQRAGIAHIDTPIVVTKVLNFLHYALTDGDVNQQIEINLATLEPENNDVLEEFMRWISVSSAVFNFIKTYKEDSLAIDSSGGGKVISPCSVGDVKLGSELLGRTIGKAIQRTREVMMVEQGGRSTSLFPITLEFDSVKPELAGNTL